MTGVRHVVARGDPTVLFTFAFVIADVERDEPSRSALRNAGILPIRSARTSVWFSDARAKMLVERLSSARAADSKHRGAGRASRGGVRCFERARPHSEARARGGRAGDAHRVHRAFPRQHVAAGAAHERWRACVNAGVLKGRTGHDDACGRRPVLGRAAEAGVRRRSTRSRAWSRAPRRCRRRPRRLCSRSRASRRASPACSCGGSRRATAPSSRRAPRRHRSSRRSRRWNRRHPNGRLE